MGTSKRLKQTQEFEINQKYTLGSQLGEGGNALVCEATELGTNRNVALKRLFKWNEEKQKRFRDEIKIMQGEGASIDGVMPILDYSEENCWYTMPVATRVMETTYVQGGNVEKIVSAFIPLLITLQELHEKGISHRDIKPANIYLLNGRLVFGDFGLVDFPDNRDLTQSDRPLGAIFTRAPEMLRDPKYADGKPADVYSMAKTLWMLLSRYEKGFDGQYNERDTAHRLNGFEHLKSIHLLEIEKLLMEATSSNPEERPTAKDFREGLEIWLELFADEDLCQVKDWEHLSEILFNGIAPDVVAYSGKEKIIKVLDEISRCPAYNHMFVPKGGGHDLDEVEEAAEEGCIRILGDGCGLVLKPKKLYFRGFKDIKWNYFLLETEEIDNTLPDWNDGWYEMVIEDTPAHYVKADDACYGVYDYDTGEPLPEGWRCEERVLKGKFLFVMKLGHYNRIPDTYDARHCDCSEEEFYKLISRYECIYDIAVKKGFEESQILSYYKFKENPFVKPEVVKEDPELPSPREFVDAHFENWRFKLPKVDNNGGSMIFFFIFDKGGSLGFHSLFEERKEWVLNKTGRIVERKKGDDKDVFFITNRETAFKIEKDLNSQIAHFCEGYNTDFGMAHFKIGWKRVGKPTHLFTKEEMVQLYRNADDRRGNKLVIDENGKVLLIPPYAEDAAYPVSRESFQARRNNVGKYSRLLSLELDYMESLEAWLCHLKNGMHVYCGDGYYPSKTEKELREEILEYYNDQCDTCRTLACQIQRGD